MSQRSGSLEKYVWARTHVPILRYRSPCLIGKSRDTISLIANDDTHGHPPHRASRQTPAAPMATDALPDE